MADSPVFQASKVVLPPKLTRRGRKPILPRVFTIQEAAIILRVTPVTISRWLKTGRLKGFQLGTMQHSAWRTTDLAILAFMGLPTPGYPVRTLQPRPPGLEGGTDRQYQTVMVKNGQTEKEAYEKRTRRGKASGGKSLSRSRVLYIGGGTPAPSGGGSSSAPVSSPTPGSDSSGAN